jgi:hypothetical protein
LSRGAALTDPERMQRDDAKKNRGKLCFAVGQCIFITLPIHLFPSSSSSEIPGVIAHG